MASLKHKQDQRRPMIGLVADTPLLSVTQKQGQRDMDFTMHRPTRAPLQVADPVAVTASPLVAPGPLPVADPSLLKQTVTPNSTTVAAVAVPPQGGPGLSLMDPGVMLLRPTVVLRPFRDTGGVRATPPAVLVHQRVVEDRAPPALTASPPQDQGILVARLAAMHQAILTHLLLCPVAVSQKPRVEVVLEDLGMAE